MKVVLLSSALSIHTVRWANALSDAGLDVTVVSQHPQIESMNKSVKVHLFPFRGVIGYFTMVPAVKKLIEKIKPDIINAHYASGYGTTARLVNYHPWLLSVWGSDVYDFPYLSPIHKRLIKGNLLAADAIASTSHCMAVQTHSLTDTLGKIAITPFGVDTAYYKKNSYPLVVNKQNNEEFVIGTVKAMATKYGIDTLIQSFSILKNNLSVDYPNIASNLRLRLIGDGPQTYELKQLATKLGVVDSVDFVGRINHLDVPKELAKLDVYVALSRLNSESFGVAIIEASAAGRPVIVSNVGGLPEVVLNGITGIIVPKEDPQSAANAIKELLIDSELRQKLAEAGQLHVQDNYSWNSCVEIMIETYKKTIRDHN